MSQNEDDEDFELPSGLTEDEDSSSFIDKLKEKVIKPNKQKVPLTFNTGVALLLFFCYLSITFVCIPTQPQLLLILVPTLYVLIRHIRLEREKYEQQLS